MLIFKLFAELYTYVDSLGIPLIDYLLAGAPDIIAYFFSHRICYNVVGVSCDVDDDTEIKQKCTMFGFTHVL